MISMTSTASRVARGRDTLEQQLGFLLARSSASSNAAVNAALAEHGMKVRTYSVLALACDPARLSQREIAEYLRLDPSQVVNLVDGMETQGLVVREPDVRDRRANVIVATEAGHALFSVLSDAVTEAEMRRHASLSSDERATLMDLLHKIAFEED